MKDDIYPEFIKFCIKNTKEISNFNFSNNAGKEKFKKIIIKIPIKVDGSYDFNKQKEIANKIKFVKQKKKELVAAKNQLNHTKIIFLIICFKVYSLLTFTIIYTFLNTKIVKLLISSISMQFNTTDNFVYCL